MELMVIEVHEIPHIPHQKWMADQLKIHFLKRKNNGGDVLTVIYPTSTPGQAYVIFESAEVPGVLECTHILDVDNRFYPIQVKKAHLSKVDMPVKTTLDSRMFPNLESVMKLLKHYDFKVTQVIPGHLQLTGSFLKLKLVRNELIRLQGQDLQPHGRAPSALRNGFAMGYDVERDSLKSISRNVDQTSEVRRHRLLQSAPPPSSSSSNRDMASGGFSTSIQSNHTSCINASSPVGAVRRHDGGASSSAASSPSSLTQPHHTSPPYRDSASVESPRSLHSSYYSSNGGTSPTTDTMHHHTPYRHSASGGSHRVHPSFDSDNSYSSSSHSSPSSSTGMAVDTDIINFIYNQQQDVLKEIEKRYGTEMGLKDNAFKSSGLTMVTFRGKNCEKAKEHFLAITEELSSSLRTQEIHLKKYDPAEQRQIHDRLRCNKDSGVMITHSDDVIKLVGTSKESFEMKRQILGRNDDPHRGRPLERNSKSRRSMSLPGLHKVVDHTRVTDHENQASSAKRYTPSLYQEESDKRQALQNVQGPEQVSDKNARRTRSKSESREKNRTNKEQTRNQVVGPPTSSQEKKTPNPPTNPPQQRVTDHLKLEDLKKSKMSHVFRRRLQNKNK